MASLGVKARTALALGLPNLARVAAYKLGVKFGVHPVLRLQASVPPGPFFSPPARTKAIAPMQAWQGEAGYFGWLAVPLPVVGYPNWHSNPLSGGQADGSLPWWKIPDFDPAVGDIKAVWEASRFDWVLAMAQRAVAGQAGEVDRLNCWLADWCRRNPPYRGPNWKCGQETSIRMMHLAMAALVLGQVEKPSPGLVDLVRLHLRRIAPTISYAMAQDNNHGTSEAAALFIGGGWLLRAGCPEGESWQRTGRRWLENRMARLVAPDGSFSQYSTNYHRVALDTFSMVEIWRRHLGLPSFTPEWRARAAAATRWLAGLVDAQTGDAPNFGGNDGARLLPLTDTGYRDHRPSVQLATALFAHRQAYPGSGAWNSPLDLLGVAVPPQAAETQPGRLSDDGGYAVLKRDGAMAVLRYPRFRFRPSHADPLHVDLWVAGENLLRDAGTFSYCASSEEMAGFAGIRGHSTVQFDDREPMPRLGRFLFGDWLKATAVQPLQESSGETTGGASYGDRAGAIHSRNLRLMADRLLIEDEIAGFKRRAVFRWRLKPGPWRIEGRVATDGGHRVTVLPGVRINRIEIVPGWESRHYLQKTEAPILEVEVAEPGKISTEYRWKLCG